MTSPKSNNNNGVAVCTSVGFQELSSADYAKAVIKLGPDIVIALGDIAHGETAGRRRQDKMFGRTERWIKELADAIATMKTDDEHSDLLVPAILAPVLPVTVEQQKWYLDLLRDELKDSIIGLAIYDSTAAADLPEALAHLPRLSMTQAASPLQLLREITNGIDVLTAPFVGLATDAGIALDFCFPSSATYQSTRSETTQSLGQGLQTRRPLATDMWLAIHATALEPLASSCTCYTCTKHTRAYLQHLLSAKEMLAWVLLQIHNLHIIESFFSGIRASIAAGRFETDAWAFEDTYEPELPEKTGAGPRYVGSTHIECAREFHC